MSKCPCCGSVITDSDAPAISTASADGFIAGRRGDSYEVPSIYEKSLPNAGLWENGWRLGSAVRGQVEDAG